MAIKAASADRFEPNSELKNWWLNTRKRKRKYGSVELPGLFTTYGFGSDAVSFFVIIALELWGLYNFWLLVGNLLYTISLFFADALLAIGSHLWSKKICLAQNRMAQAKYGIVYMENKNPSEEILIEKNKLKKYRLYSSVFQILIFALAIFKIFSFLGNYPEGINGLSITIIFSYLLVAVLHIRSTGYFLSEIIRNFREKRQYNIHLNSDDISKFTITNRREFNLETYRKHNYKKLLKLNESLNYKEKHDNPVTYEDVLTGHHILEGNEIHSYGVLDDDDLHNLIDGQKNIQQKENLAIFGLIHQIEILNSNAFRRKNRTHGPYDTAKMKEIKKENNLENE